MAQIDPALGLREQNLELHLNQADKAVREGAELLVFPELSLTGYLVKDMVPDLGLAPDDPFLAPLYDLSRKLDLVFGFVEDLPDGNHCNSLAWLSGGECVHVHRKIYLPTYGMFEEGRYFASGQRMQAFETRFGRMAMAICEDLWHPSVSYLAFLDGALGLIVGSASPVRGVEKGPNPPKTEFWQRLLEHDASLYGAFLVFANRYGVEDGINFWGGSRLISPSGATLAEGPLHEEALLFGEVDMSEVHRRRDEFSLLRDESPELTFRNLERILRERAGTMDSGEGS